MTPEERARAIWPRLRDEAGKHGVVWAKKPGKAQVALLAARIRQDDLDEDDLLRIIRGYIIIHGTEMDGDFNPLMYLRVSTLYRVTKYPDYLAAGLNPPPRNKPQGSRPQPHWAGPEMPSGTLAKDLTPEQREEHIASEREAYEVRRLIERKRLEDLRSRH